MRRFANELRILGTVILCVVAAQADASFVEWKSADGGNGHWYGFVSASGLTWRQARDAAFATSFRGGSGHLVTVTSAAEDAFLVNNFSTLIGDPTPLPNRPIVVPGVYAWIGLTDEIQEGNYRWVTGEAFTYSRWSGPEPSGFDYPEQDYMNLWRRDYGNGAGPEWGWDDTINSPAIPGYGSYLIEFDGPLSSVPEPTACGLLLMGIIGVGLIQKRACD